MFSKMKQFGLVAVGVLAGILLSLNFSAVAQRDATTRLPLPIEELRSFAEVFGAIKSGYVEPVDDKKLISGAINGMLSDLDPHSAYLDQEAFKELQVGTQGEFGGLGIEVGMEDGFIKVVSPIEDSPAFRAGLKPNDLIVKLDETPVKGMSLNDAVKKMRGKPKTSIRLTIVRKGEDKPFEVTLMRDVIRVQSVKSKLIEPGYGWVRISQFQEHTGENLVKHLQGLYKDGPLKGLVLDLRNDPGGLLNGAVAVSAAFLPANALVVSTDGRTDDARRKFIAAPEDYLRGRDADFLKGLPAGVKNVPMVVLINGGSASASEIVAGALQDHKRSTVLGTQSFGKGSVQTIMPLGNATAIKLTTARYFTPLGRSIQAKGITPDVLVQDPDSPELGIREADLNKHLANPADPSAKPVTEQTRDEIKANDKDQDSKGAQPKPEEKAAAAAKKPAVPLEFASDKDFVFQQGLNHLKGLPVKASPVAQTAAVSGQARR